MRNLPLLLAVSGLICSVAQAQIVDYSQNFDSMVVADGSAADSSLQDGWLVGANVYNPGGDYLYGYFSFPAPNVGTHFSAVVSGQGGIDQGTNQLSVFSDYNNSSEHTNGNIVESVVFREYTVGAGNVGETWQFEFDAKLGNLAAPTTALAFIKTLNPAAGYAQTNFITSDMTAIPTSWGTYQVSLEIDAGLVGQVFQIGFSNNATNFNSSGVFYDNVNLTVVPVPATYALLGGSAAIGLVMYRRRKSN